MPFPYKTVLVIGATSGIGLAVAEKMISNGSHVIAVGRRQEKLDSLVQKHGSHHVSTVKFDITDLPAIPAFISSVIEAHPTLDCAFLNSGMQRGIDFRNPSSINLNNIALELTTNYTSHIHLTVALLPFLQAQSPRPTALIFTTSGLALVPITRCPNYCATKAAMHHIILVMREQLASYSNMKIIEIFPPAVQTELHSAKNQPDIMNGEQIGMPLEEFTEEAWKGLENGEVDIPVGMARKRYEGLERTRLEMFKEVVEAMKGKGL